VNGVVTMTNDEVAAELERLLERYDDVCEHGRDGSDIMDKLAHFLAEHRDAILDALRAEPSEAPSVWKEAAEVVGDYQREIHGTVGQGAYKVLLHLMEAEHRLTARAARSRP
jgi:dsDNA-binding SOS-regulon protein